MVIPALSAVLISDHLSKNMLGGQYTLNPSLQANTIENFSKFSIYMFYKKHNIPTFQPAVL